MTISKPQERTGMSAPNDNYDPKQVAALSAESLQAAITAAGDAFDARPDVLSRRCPQLGVG